MASPTPTSPTKRAARPELAEPARKRPRMPPGPVTTEQRAAAIADEAEALAAYNAAMAEHAARIAPIRARRAAARRRRKQIEARLDKQRAQAAASAAWHAQQAADARQAELDRARDAEAAKRRGATMRERYKYALQVVVSDVDGQTLEFPEDLAWAETTLRNGGITAALDARDRVDAVCGTCPTCGRAVRNEWFHCDACDAHVHPPGCYDPDPEFADHDRPRRAEAEDALYGYGDSKGWYDAVKLSQAQIDQYTRPEG